MKKTVKITALLLCFCLMFTACGSKQSEESGSGDSQQTSDTASGVTDFNYSQSITEDGMWEGVNAKELVHLPDYSQILVKQSDIDEQIKYYLTTYSDEIKVMDRAVQDGDYVNIDYV